MGFNIDEWVSFSTAKTVWVRDRYVGFLYYVLLFLVVCYIVFYQILWNNDDFIYQDVAGISRMWLSHPTVGECDPQIANCKSDFNSMRGIPYCEIATEPLPQAQKCMFQGKNSVAPQGEVDDKLFIPTAVELIREKKTCEPAEENNWVCENEFTEEPGTNCTDPSGAEKMCRNRGGRSGQYFYVADVERFRIEFSSTYERAGVQGTSLESQGFYYDCEDWGKQGGVQTWEGRLNSTENTESIIPRCPSNVVRRPLKCLEGRPCSQNEKAPSKLGRSHAEQGFLQVGRRGRWESLAGRRGGGRLGVSQEPEQEAPPPPEATAQLPQDAPPVQPSAPPAQPNETAPSPPRPGRAPAQYSTFLGDTFTVGRLLELAGIGSLDDLRNREGWTGRQSGVVLEVQVVYNNMYRLLSNFGYQTVEYTYKVREMPMAYVSRQVLSVQQPDDYPASRNYEVQHGIILWFRVSGSFGTFNMAFALVMLAAAFALVSVASGVTDMVAIYVHPRRKNYFKLKYEVSPNFDKMWRCEVCGYYNHERDASCQGLDRWQSTDDHELCGAARP